MRACLHSSRRTLDSIAATLFSALLATALAGCSNDAGNESTDDDACTAGQCEADASPPLDSQSDFDGFESTLEPVLFQFQRRSVTSLTDRFVGIAPAPDWEDEGAGGALFDYDGDQDMDLLVGGHVAGDSDACILRNISSQGTIAFEEIDEFCPGPIELVHSGTALDLDRDGRHELLIAGREDARVVQFFPEYREWDLLEVLEQADVPYNCSRGVVDVQAMDLNLDGYDDPIIGCRPSGSTDGGVFTFLWRPQTESFDHVTTDLEVEGYLMSIGSTDINSDGLLDFLVLQGSTLLGEWTNYQWHPGGIFQRTPTPSIQFDYAPFETEKDAWGAQMGAAVFHDVAATPYLFLTDWGLTRLYNQMSFPAPNVAENSALALDVSDVSIATWANLVDDFNRDGIEDIFVTEGPMVEGSAAEFRAHQDVIAIQNRDGTFDIESASLGLRPHTPGLPKMQYEGFSSRSALRTDFDQNGQLDLVVFALEGPPTVYTEVGAFAQSQKRCTVIPDPAYVDSHGYGYRVHNENYQHPLRWNIQGQVRAGQSPWWSVPFRQGVLEFPTGYRQPFQCDDGTNRVIVSEPDWIGVDWSDEFVTVELDDRLSANPAIGITLQLFDSEGAVVEAITCDARTCSAGVENVHQLMIKDGERWIPKLFEAP